MAAPAARRCCSVAVVGAGAAGLVAARELRREGHGVVVFERAASVGGTWIYTPDVEDDDPLSVDPGRRIVHSSLYASLRTNIPREIMGFLDYPFVPKDGSVDRRRYPRHQEVLRYLEDFALDFDLRGMIRFETEVLGVEMEKGGRWTVKSRGIRGGDGDDSEVYDGVLVCNGHYSEPRIAEISGIDTWPGKQIHSRNYREPNMFLDKVVVLIGSSASAVDISRELAGFAKGVHIAVRSAPERSSSKQPGYENIWIHPMIGKAVEDGTLVFQDGFSCSVDVIIHCTGYKYHFPFLETNGIVTVDDNCVGPLYQHVFPPSLAPGLSFIGLPWKVAPFPLFELQSKWVAGILSRRIELPTQEEMMEDVEAQYKEIEAMGWPKRYTHNMDKYQFEYDNWLAARCGHPGVEGWRVQMYAQSRIGRAARPESYRDDGGDDHLFAQAYDDFKRFSRGSL